MCNCLKLTSRISAWGLLIGVIILVISGWGITHTEIIYKASFGLIDRGVANFIHRIMHVPLAIIFLTHVLSSVRLKLPSKYLKRLWLANSLIIAIGITLLSLVVYIEYLI